MRRRSALIIATAVLAAVAIAGVLGGDSSDRVPVPPAPIPTPPGQTRLPPLTDPFTYDHDRRTEFEQRAAAGHAHVLYSRSPGGAAGTAERVARWRPRIEAAAREAGVDANLIEGLVFLESAGREDAITPFGIEGAVGLTQIVSGTATQLLGMKVDVARSERLTQRIRRALLRGRLLQVQRLRRERARVDERFDPVKALAGTARYLKLALAKFGSAELALESYHMGMGNLEGVLRAYVGEGGDTPIGDLVRDRDLRWAQVYFDTTPLRHPQAHARLAALGDDSSNYLWKLYAARDVMALHRSDPAGLIRLEELQTAKASAEELLHPPGETETFASPDALQRAWDAGTLVPFPDDPALTGLRVDRRMGELATRLKRPRTLYRGLRPEALALALYVGAQVRAMAGDPRSALTVTSTVRDGSYQRLLTRRNIEATRSYSLHTTGWSFDVLRRYRSKRQALAFQFVLDRLQALNLIAWVREPAAIHVTVSEEASALLPLLDRVQ